MTVIELIEAGAKRLADAGVAFGHGTTNAFDESAWLVLWKLGLPLDDLAAAESQWVGAPEGAAVLALIEERIHSRRPAAYLTREAWLQGLPFYVDERAIVPRSFIAELLADGSIEPWLTTPDGRDGHEGVLHVLDLCTGNGSLAILAALTWPQASVVGADLSPDALDVARINVEKHGVSDRVRLLQSDGLAAVEGSFDLILCNPPYVNTRAMAELPAEYRAEPALALAGGDDGMDLIRRLLADAPRYMNPQGALVLEIGNERDHFEAAFARLEVVWLDTSAGGDQVLLVTREALEHKDLP